MKNYVFDGESDSFDDESKEEDKDASGDDDLVEGFDKDDEEADECAECGAAVAAEKKVVKAIDGEEYTFCSEECAKEFDAKTHNQKYCEENCCRIATNKRIMEKYYEKKAIKSGALRECIKCKAKLSRYNQGSICVLCEKNININSKKKVLSLLDEIDQLS